MITKHPQIIDLTYVLTKDMPTWSGLSDFKQELVCDHNPDDIFKFRKHSIVSAGGVGTHMDAPIHCSPAGKTIDQYTASELYSPCFVIDIPGIENPNCMLLPQDILKFEERHGKIASDAFVIVRSGWGTYWNTPEKYRNDYAFPSVSPEAAQLLLDRNVAGLGVDTLSPDTGAKGFPVHNLMLEAGKYMVENIANVEQLPPVGSYTQCAPMNIKDAAEAPVRLMAYIYN